MEDYLKDFQALEVNSEIPLLSRFKEPRAYEVPFDAGSNPDGRKAPINVELATARGD